MTTVVEFYKVTFLNEDTSNPMSIADYFNALKPMGFQDEYDRDFFDIKKIQNKYCGGIFRKIRTDEIIETGKVGVAGKQIPYKQGEGKLENNHFVYFSDKDIIGYIRNRHANHFKRLEKCLSEAFSRRVQLSPIITQGSLNTILNNKTVVKMDVSVPINASQISKNGQLWSDEAMRAVAKSGVDILKLEANMDLRAGNHGKLKNAYENIKNFLSVGATRAVVKVQDIDGKYDTIDLIADKIEYVDKSFSYTKDVKLSSDIYDTIIVGYLDKLDEIEQVC